MDDEQAYCGACKTPIKNSEWAEHIKTPLHKEMVDAFNKHLKGELEDLE